MAAPALAAIDFSEWLWQNVPQNVRLYCERAQTFPIPEKHRPSIAQAKELNGCSSADLYYGIGMEVDPVKARHCAIMEMEDSVGLVWGGESILMMLYANGMGAPRDIDLAHRFACAVGHSPAEVTGRAKHLEKIRKDDVGGLAPLQPEARFDLCDDITSGFMAGHCASLDERKKASIRDKRLLELQAGWTDAERKSFAALHAAFAAYVDTRGQYEVDLSGTARSAFIFEEEARMRDLFTSQLAAFESGRDLPDFPDSRLGQVDHDLNAAYRVIQSVPDGAWEHGRGPWGTVKKTGIRSVQRAWIKYRDAWVAFGAVKYPAVSANSWKTWQTLERLEHLREDFPIPE